MLEEAQINQKGWMLRVRIVGRFHDPIQEIFVWFEGFLEAIIIVAYPLYSVFDGFGDSSISAQRFKE